ncbi:MAG: ATP-dependent DNA helicase RecG [Saprospiraceae bacterium]|nr:ATP-dependent DNA helicase RecG [Saprospiraceae bacterium]
MDCEDIEECADISSAASSWKYPSKVVLAFCAARCSFENVFTDKLDQELTYLKGVGPTKSELLKKELGLASIRDMLMDYPFRYEDRTLVTPIAELKGDNQVVQLRGVIENLTVVGGGRKKRLTGKLRDQTGKVELVWFRGIKWLKENLKTNTPYTVYGRASRFRSKINIAHPEVELYNPKKPSSTTFVPVYRSTERLSASGMDSKGRRKVMKAIFEQLSAKDLPEHLPEYLVRKMRLLPYHKAIATIHFPVNSNALLEAERRLKFEELLLLQLDVVKHYKARRITENGHVFESIGPLFNTFYRDHLSFELTGAQKRVLKEIRQDFKTGIQMNRLLQGDVGSGKTIVALMAMLMSIDNGFQGCLIAPTEILSQQHFQSLQSICKGLDLRIGLLTGSVKGTHRKELLKLLRLGEIHILVGTHALLEDHVQYQNLGMVIIDEQHRFGVAQRARLWEKGRDKKPHVLVMTATPIPRTLHMTIYGDLDVSTIDELPPGRKPITTLHKTEYHRPKLIKFIKQEITKGRQVYVVYPLIEESAKLDLEDLNNGYEKLLHHFSPPEYQISVVHGRMKQEEKDFEMQRFVEGKTQIMVATTVIEVGVNVPNASLMIIENSERFGLAQLHQLRGRVGRGAEKSYCVLMSSYRLSEEAKERLSTMVRTQNGFEIAEVDLHLRGPGSIEGTQQSGLPMLRIAHLTRDREIMLTARKIAERILDQDPELDAAHHAKLKQYLKKYTKRSRDWSRIS